MGRSTAARASPTSVNNAHAGRAAGESQASRVQYYWHRQHRGRQQQSTQEMNEPLCEAPATTTLHVGQPCRGSVSARAAAALEVHTMCVSPRTQRRSSAPAAVRLFIGGQRPPTTPVADWREGTNAGFSSFVSLAAENCGQKRRTKDVKWISFQWTRAWARTTRF